MLKSLKLAENGVEIIARCAGFNNVDVVAAQKKVWYKFDLFSEAVARHAMA
jgi:lactate dehydrogenase-like 2-hydroxyacid dehydrogenase